MERRSFIGLLAGAFASIFAAPKVFDFGKTKGYQTYLFGKDVNLSDMTGGWGSLHESSAVYYDKELIANLKGDIPGWTSYKFRQTSGRDTPPPGRGMSRTFFQYDKLGTK